LASRLPRQVKLFGAVSLLNDFASEMVYPLLPAFVTTVLGGGATALGALDGSAELASSAVKYGAGRVSDRPARRGPLVISGYALAVLVRPLVALTAATWQVIALRVVDRLGKGARTPPRDAIIADVTQPEMLGRAFGLQRSLDHAGAVLGPVAAWLLLSSGAAQVRGVIAASLIPGIAVLLLAIWAVKNGRGRATSDEATPPPPSPDLVRPRPTSILPIVAFHLLRMPETLLILRSQQLGVPVTTVPLLWAAVHVTKSATSAVAGAWSDRIGSSKTMWLGWASYAVIAAGFAFASGAMAAWTSFLAFGAVAGLTEAPERALVARSYGGDRRGSGFGSYHALVGLAALVGGLLLGLLYDARGAFPAFAASALAALVLCVVALRWGNTPTS
jgi:MFS family permease